MSLNPITWFKQIKALFKIKKEINKMKLSELKTSEGRMTLILNIIAIYSVAHGFLPAPLVAKIAAASIAAYGIARAIVKAGEAIAKITPTPKDDAIVAEAGKILDTVAPKPPAP